MRFKNASNSPLIINEPDTYLTLQGREEFDGDERFLTHVRLGLLKRVIPSVPPVKPTLPAGGVGVSPKKVTPSPFPTLTTGVAVEGKTPVASPEPPQAIPEVEVVSAPTPVEDAAPEAPINAEDADVVLTPLGEDVPVEVFSKPIEKMNKESLKNLALDKGFTEQKIEGMTKKELVALLKGE